jgi:hypothetical protein
MSSRLSLVANVGEMAGAPKPLISPQVGEMPGRAEGGASRQRPYHPTTEISGQHAFALAPLALCVC